MAATERDVTTTSAPKRRSGRFELAPHILKRKRAASFSEDSNEAKRSAGAAEISGNGPWTPAAAKYSSNFFDDNHEDRFRAVSSTDDRRATTDRSSAGVSARTEDNRVVVSTPSYSEVQRARSDRFVAARRSGGDFATSVAFPNQQQQRSERVLLIHTPDEASGNNEEPKSEGARTWRSSGDGVDSSDIASGRTSNGNQDANKATGSVSPKSLIATTVQFFKSILGMVDGEDGSDRSSSHPFLPSRSQAESQSLAKLHSPPPPSSSSSTAAAFGNSRGGDSSSKRPRFDDTNLDSMPSLGSRQVVVNDASFPPPNRLVTASSSSSSSPLLSSASSSSGAAAAAASSPSTGGNVDFRLSPFSTELKSPSYISPFKSASPSALPFKTPYAPPYSPKSSSSSAFVSPRCAKKSPSSSSSAILPLRSSDSASQSSAPHNFKTPFADSWGSPFFDPDQSVSRSSDSKSTFANNQHRSQSESAVDFHTPRLTSLRTRSTPSAAAAMSTWRMGLRKMATKTPPPPPPSSGSASKWSSGAIASSSSKTPRQDIMTGADASSPSYRTPQLSFAGNGSLSLLRRSKISGDVIVIDDEDAEDDYDYYEDDDGDQSADVKQVQPTETVASEWRKRKFSFGAWTKSSAPIAEDRDRSKSSASTPLAKQRDGEQFSDRIYSATRLSSAGSIVRRDDDRRVAFADESDEVEQNEFGSMVSSPAERALLPYTPSASARKRIGPSLHSSHTRSSIDRQDAADTPSGQAAGPGADLTYPATFEYIRLSEPIRPSSMVSPRHKLLTVDQDKLRVDLGLLGFQDEALKSAYPSQAYDDSEVTEEDKREYLAYVNMFHRPSESNHIPKVNLKGHSMKEIEEIVHGIEQTTANELVRAEKPGDRVALPSSVIKPSRRVEQLMTGDIVGDFKQKLEQAKGRLDLSTPKYKELKQIEVDKIAYLKEKYAKLAASVRHDNFPALPEDAEARISAAFKTMTDRPVVSNFNETVNGQDIRRLTCGDGDKWLNDVVVNYYMQMIKDRATKAIEAGRKDVPKVHVFHSDTMDKIIKKNDRLHRITKKVDLFAMDFVLLPVHLGNHWCLANINFRKKRFEYYDSLCGSNEQLLRALKEYIVAEHLDKKKSAYNVSDWTFYTPKDIPRQENAHDCSVFACTFADYIARDEPFDFHQRNMKYLRKRMVLEILNSKLFMDFRSKR